MKIQYGIVGFIVGIMTGLLLALVETKLMRGSGRDTMMPFIIGITVLGCIITGVSVGVRKANRRLRE